MIFNGLPDRNLGRTRKIEARAQTRWCAPPQTATDTMGFVAIDNLSGLERLCRLS